MIHHLLFVDEESLYNISAANTLADYSKVTFYSVTVQAGLCLPWWKSLEILYAVAQINGYCLMPSLCSTFPIVSGPGLMDQSIHI